MNGDNLATVTVTAYLLYDQSDQSCFSIAGHRLMNVKRPVPRLFWPYLFILSALFKADKLRDAERHSFAKVARKGLDWGRRLRIL